MSLSALHDENNPGLHTMTDKQRSYIKLMLKRQKMQDLEPMVDDLSKIDAAFWITVLREGRDPVLCRLVLPTFSGNVDQLLVELRRHDEQQFYLKRILKSVDEKNAAVLRQQFWGPTTRGDRVPNPIRQRKNHA